MTLAISNRFHLLKCIYKYTNKIHNIKILNLKKFKI